MSEILMQISENLQHGKAKVVRELVQQAMDEGLEAKDILEGGMLAGMSVVGDKFKSNEIYVPDVLIAAKAMNSGMELLKPFLQQSNIQARGKVILGTVKGDQHDIGKNLVKMMMEGKGLEVIDLGTSVPAEKFISTFKETDSDVIACSALLTTTMGEMKKVVQLLQAEGLRDKAIVMVGGAPVTEQFCRNIGADIYTPDAASAADEAAKACAGRNNLKDS